MYPLLLFTVIITVLSGPVEASNPFADLIVSDTPMDGTYSDIDGVLCQLCCLPLYQCFHGHMNPYGAASPFYVDPSVLHMPPLGFDRTQPDLAPIYDFVNEGQPLLREHVQVMDANETMVQPATVQAHVEDTYNPGDRLATPRNRKRQPPRPGGFHCDKDGCSKTFNRQCDLNRHQKKHSTDKPHVCSKCPMSFDYPKDLRRHLPQHNDPSFATDKYLCPHPGCGNLDGFSRRDNLLRHQRRQHPAR